MIIDPNKLLNALIAGGISLTGTIVAVAMEQPAGAGFNSIGELTWLVIAATAAGSFLKDWQSRRKQS